MKTLEEKVLELEKILFKSWSIKSSTLWSKENPAKGQCGVTSLVVQDIVGGKIKKTQAPGGWHFYNEINGKFFDLTSSQFTIPINYMNLDSSRSEAFLDTNLEQYNYLRGEINSYIYGVL